MFAAISAGEEPLLLAQISRNTWPADERRVGGRGKCVWFLFAQLMPVIVQAAHDGDRVAQTTLERGGEELAGLELQVIGRLAGNEPGIEDGLKIAGTGSIWKHVPEVSEVMRRMLLDTYPGLEFVPGSVDPLEGALSHARRLAESEGR
jgi:glucosamine kinase